MPMKLLVFLLLLIISVRGFAQTAERIYDKYTEFNLARLEGRTDNAFEIGEEIKAYADLLPTKTRTGFFNGLAKLYEDAGQLDKARPLYEAVAKSLPDYYVVHLALGHIYLQEAEAFSAKLNAAAAAKNKAAYQQAVIDYKNAARKVLPHLEKAQACDPNEQNLDLIKLLYKNLNDSNGLSTLNKRLVTLRKNCLDIIDEN